MSNNKPKPGSNPADAAKVIGKNDFGAKESDVLERTYASGETKRNDPGRAVAHSGRTRTSGVGGNDSGRGSSSGGDVDAGEDALIGFGDKNLHPAHDRQTAAPATRRPVMNPPVVDTADPTRAGELDNESSTSAADVNNETVEDLDDSFEGDVTADEAAGEK